MASAQSLYGDAELLHVLVDAFRLEAELSVGIQAAGAAHIQFSLCLGIHVDEDITFKYAALESLGSGHAGLLVDSEEGLYRSVRDVLGLEDGHCHGAADTVVGSEGGALGLYPLTVDVCLHRVFLPVVLYVVVVLRHHVEVALEDDALAVLHAGCGGLADDDVADLVADGLQSEALAEILHEVHGPPLFFRGTRNLCQRMEVLPYAFGIQIVNSHTVDI